MRLQAKLLLGMVPAIVLALLAVAWAVFTQLRNHSEQSLLLQMERGIEQVHEQTDSFFATAHANARLFANSTIVQRYIQVEDEEQRFNLMQPAVLELFASYRRAYPDYTQIQLLLPDGYEDTRLGRPGSVNETEEEGGTRFFRAMAASGQPAFSSFLAESDTGRPMFRSSHRILIVDRRLDPALALPALHGYLVVTAELPFLKRQVARQRFGRTGYLFVVDAEGKVVEHLDRSRIGAHVGDIDRLAALADRAGTDGRVRRVSRADRAGKDGDGRTGSYLPDDGPLILRAARLHPDLLLVGVLPESELKAASRDLAWTIAVITLVSICLATIFFWTLLRVLVMQPLAFLQRTAVAIGDGVFEPESTVAAPRRDEIGELELAFRDMNGKLSRSMTELQGSYARIHELAFKDSLTGLANRRQILKSLATDIADAARRGSRLAVLFLDLDGFKKINDLLGHEIGDALLLTISQRLRECLRAPAESTRIGRLGGDEFIAVIPDVDGAHQAIAVAERVRNSVTRSMHLRGNRVSVGSSIGVALYPDHAGDADALLGCADMAMYAVKHETKNGSRLYDPGMQQCIERQVRLEADLRLALEREEFHLVYQPQLEARTDRVVGVEALVRWKHPERGTVAPDEFIPAAEQTGLIEPLGAWVIDEACRQWRRWSEIGLVPVRVAVNVSRRQFVLQDVVAVVEAALQRHRVPPHMLEIEITESCMMEALSTMLDTLGRLRRRGVRIAMDDFGTGHSSLAMLATLPIDTLKIDRSFVTDVHTRAQKGSIMSALLSLARDLNLETVAEGVETEQEGAFLRACECDILQGYLLSRPLAVDKTTGWLVSRQQVRMRRA